MEIPFTESSAISGDKARIQIADCCFGLNPLNPNEVVCDRYLLEQRFTEFFKYQEDIYKLGQKYPNTTLKDLSDNL